MTNFNRLAKRVSNAEIKNAMKLGNVCYSCVHFAIKKCEDQNMQKHKFAFCCIWL